MSFGDEADTGFATARGRDWPSVRQYNVFLANRVGALLDLVRCFETTDVKLVALTVVETADCAIIRLVPSDAERAYELLTRAKLPFTESDLLVVKLPDNDQPLLTIFKALLVAEINIHYAYPLLHYNHGQPAMALYVDDPTLAAELLLRKGFTLLAESDLDK